MCHMVTKRVNRECDWTRLQGTEPIWHSQKMAKQRHFIKEWRKHRGLTQETLGERIGVDRTYVSKIEKGRKRYDQPFLEAAAVALACSPADLIMRDPTQPDALWSILERVPASERQHATDAAAAVLETFAKKTGTHG